MSRIETEHGVELGHDKLATKNRKAAEYEQFQEATRLEAARMSEFYKVFYCLENSIRQLVADTSIDYTNFGELSQLITDNWDLFDPVFQSKTAVSTITNHLDLLRGPIAHCNPTDELEQYRLNLAVRTWFKIMS